MPQENSVINESRIRLQHLKHMPETPIRIREMRALERVIATAPAPKSEPVKRTRKTPARQELVDDDDEDDQPVVTPPTTHRRVESVDGKKRVVIRAPRKSEMVAVEDPRAAERARKQRLDDALASVGLTHRGMS
jgi:hypothetical protein